MMNRKLVAICHALAAAALYAVNVPCSKALLADMPPVCLAGLLYVGAGLGVGVLYLFRFKGERKEDRLSRGDLPFAAGMVALDIVAPILLMLGIKLGTSANASLLGNFEIVATTLVALLLFRERVSRRLWAAILLIAASSAILSFEGAEGFRFSVGSLFVLGATVCWGFENNCTRRISEKSTYQIVTVKGLCSGIGSLAVSAVAGEGLPPARLVAPALLLGFVAYGLSIFTYVRAQKDLGAAKTSAYYAIAPFIGSFLAFAVLGERLTAQYGVALLVMAAGTAFVVYDTLLRSHEHEHVHVYYHVHGGTKHTHVVVHSHPHEHVFGEGRHRHHHDFAGISHARMEKAPEEARVASEFAGR